MQIPANQPDPINSDQVHPPDALDGITPITLSNDQKTNIYDDPFAAFVDSGLYKAFIFLFTCVSASVIIFLRYRIGLRLVRMWVFLLLFALLGGSSLVFSGGWFIFLGGTGSSHGFDLAWFSLFMLAVGYYRNQVAKELVEHPTHPLHTMARGNSYLTRLLSRAPHIYGIGWRATPSFHFMRPRWFPLEEPAIQRLAEPLLLVIVGGMLSFSGSPVGGWLMLCAIALGVVESDYHIKGENHYYNMKDAEIEGKVMKAMHDPQYRQQTTEKDGKIGGIAVVSDELRQMRARRLQSQR